MNQLYRDRLTAVVVGAASIASLVVVGALVLPALAAATLPAGSDAIDALHVQQDMPGKPLDAHLASFAGTNSATTAAAEVNLVAIGAVPTGVYSSEGLTSVHTAYAGPYVTPPRLATPTDEAVYGWSKLTGWTKIPVLDAQSFSFLDAIKTDTGRGGECAAAATGGLCL